MNPPRKSLSLNEEYLCTIRTKSFADFFIKVQILETSSSSDLFLDPGQEAIASVLEFSDHQLKPLLLNYFDVSAEASRFCSQLLRTLNQIQSDHRSIQEVINDPDSSVSELRARVVTDDALSVLNTQRFTCIQIKHSSVLQQLKLERKKVGRKMKIINFFNKALGVCVTAMCDQLDVAAKGAYILNRDFDTMGRLVARLQDEIKHKKTIIELGLERMEDRFSVEVLKELNKYEVGFSKQVQELQEHVYLCLVTINKARALVVKEINLQ